jgi:hypothetical protein
VVHCAPPSTPAPIDRVRPLLVGIALALGWGVAAARDAALPAQNLRIEWRWVRAAEPAAASSGGAAYVVGTQRVDRGVQPVRQLIVANGETASVGLNERTSQPALDYAVEVPVAGPRATPSPRPPIAPPRPAPDAGRPAAGSDRLPGPGVEVYAVPRDAAVERTRGFEVGVRWAGGSRPVRVRIRATLPAPEGAPDVQGELDTTVDVALGRWQTVAIGARDRSPDRGAVVVGTRAIDRNRPPDLQLRVTLAR